MMKGAACLGLTVLLLVALFANMRPEEEVSAADGVVEPQEISKALGNGPQEITSLKDFGMSSDDLSTKEGTFKGTIDGNTVRLGDINSMVSSDVGATYFGSSAKYLNMNSIGDSIPINMKSSWTLDLEINVAKTYPNNSTYLTGAGLAISIIGADGKEEVFEMCDGGNRALRHENDRFSWLTVIKADDWLFQDAEDSGVYRDCTLTYDPSAEQYVFKYGKLTKKYDAYYKDRSVAEVRIYGYTLGSTNYTTVTSTDEVNYEYVEFAFDSFKYNDYYIKAANHLTDYAGRNITGAIGNGHTVKVHPTVYNDTDLSQSYPGTVELNPEKTLKNIELKGSMANYPYTIPFTQNSTDLLQDFSFDAVIDCGDYNDENGKEFILPLQVSDDYFCKNPDLIDLANDPNSGVPGTWHNIKYNSGDGLKEQLPLDIGITRNTCRQLSSDLDDNPAVNDYTHMVKGKAAKPNDNGWYQDGVKLTTSFDPDEFNEMILCKKDGTGGPDYAAAHMTTISNNRDHMINGSGDNGNSDTAAGNTYFIFGRKGNNKITETLSAISEETFRIDNLAPEITVKDRTKRTLQAEDNLSGIDYIEWKGPKDTKYSEANKESITRKSNTEGFTSRTFNMPQFTETGVYTFRAVDLAGNASEELLVTNNAPEIKAADATVSFQETIVTQDNEFKITDVLKASVSDVEETIGKARLHWVIKKDGGGMDEISGDGEAALSTVDWLPAGTYTVTFTLNGGGKDSDGNKAEEKEVKLTVEPADPPYIKELDSQTELDPVSAPDIHDDGTAHITVRGETTLIVDPDNIYSGGTITQTAPSYEAQKEVEKLFGSFTGLPAPADNLTVKVKILKDNKDVTAKGIDTTKNGEYVIVYKVTDAAGNSVTLQMDYKVKTDLTVTFLPGKGEFSDGNQRKTTAVGYDKAPDTSQIPGKNDITPPVERCFIGWSTTQDSGTAMDPSAVKLTAEVTYYAVYAEDVNRNDIPDSEEAIFFFKSSDPDHAAFKYADKTTVGIPVPKGSTAVLSKSHLPELLFDRNEDNLYRLKGWKTSATGDTLLSTEELLALAKGPGTKTTVTAIIEESESDYNGKVKVTFFSSDPKTSPLDGGEGQAITIDAPKPEEPVTIPKEYLPSVKLGEKCKLEGWKTSDTGDLILPEEAIASQKLYGGKELTCIAYVDSKKEIGTVPDKNQETDKKPETRPDKDQDKDTETKTEKTNTTVKNKVIKEKQVIKQTAETQNNAKDQVTFIFYTSAAKRGTIKSGDGTTVILPAPSGRDVSITKELIPGLNIGGNSSFYGWKTSLTGGRILSTKELCALKVSPGVMISCTAYFKYKEVRVQETDDTKASGGSQKSLSTIDENQVPLGSAPGTVKGVFKNRSKNSSLCMVHYIMLAWLLLSLLTFLWRLYRRKQQEEFLFSDEEGDLARFRSPEDYDDLYNNLRTDVRDYVFMVCDLGIGIALFTAGVCFLELPLLLAGGVMNLLYLFMLKRMDKKEKKAAAEAAGRIDG